MRSSSYDGVTFYEGQPSNLRVGQKISIRRDGIFKSTQLGSLDDVKKEMARQCKALGYTIVVKFKYGQRSSGYFSSLLSRDNVYWYGEGYTASLID